MPLANCRACGRLYARGVSDLCDTCRAAEDKDFERVQAALDEEPSLDVNGLAETSGVDRGRILQFLRTGRLILAEGALPLSCESCGAPIDHGRYCARCGQRLQTQLAADVLPPTGGVYTWNPRKP